MELRRLNWRRGSDGELIVELDSHGREGPRLSLTEAELARIGTLPKKQRLPSGDSEEIELEDRKNASTYAFLSDSRPLSADPEILEYTTRDYHDVSRNWSPEEML